VNFYGSNLTDAGFINGSNLTDAVLADTNLGGANLNGAVLVGANLNGANLNGTESSKNAPLPQGWVRDPATDRLMPAKSGA
jgi:uncharacterized protein YjbI with pentapeptide repeats